MNQKNLGYLSERVREAGFPEPVIEKLKERMKDASADFSIEYQPDFGDDAVIAILHFKNWKETDLYYFHRYHLILSRENTNDCLQQVFYCGKNGPVIDLRKGYNLLCGRAVYREKLLSHLKEEYNAWVQLNFLETDSKGNFKFQPFYDGYGFDLERVLECFPFLELNEAGKLNLLMTGLKQGNREPVTLSLDGKINTYYIEALPQFKSLRIYDAAKKQLSGKALTLIITLSQQGDNLPAAEAGREKETAVLEPVGKKGKLQNKRIRA